MRLSRRDLAFLLPALAAGNQPALPAKVYHAAKIPYEGDSRKKGRRFFYGANRSGFLLECHETVLGPGTQTHAPHKHAHEEIVVLTEGTLEALLDGRAETVESGSVLYFASNLTHSVRNAGAAPCRYYVIELRGNEA